MEPITCSKCGGPTNIKMLKGPKYQGPIGECTSGCRNPDKPQYALGTFPPKQKTQGALNNPDATKYLGYIANSLSEIVQILRMSKDPLEREADKF